jgi:nitroimidazol reductase NimA-like FMN-containing flavoprotein (pyridoxamine 5'-phosphate oxidase superfamily)
LDLVAHSRLGRLACARGNMPYIVPLYFAYDDEYLYSFGTFGHKIEWMRVNPNVCVEVDEVINPQH